jgi:hypothetical protein
MSVLEGLPAGESSELNEATTKKKWRVTKELSIKSFLSC